MDRSSWLRGRKSMDNSAGETESSGSISSHSGRYSEEHEAQRLSSVKGSPSYTQSPEIISTYHSNETTKSLSEKLSEALSNINAKEKLVEQHVKLTEEAVSGWEKAEADAASLKKQLESALQKNLALESKIVNLDGALKECVRQLRKSREEQELKFHESLIKKSKEWDNEKIFLQSQVIELQAKLEVKSETVSSIDHQLLQKVNDLEKEKSSLQIELLARTEELHLRTLERDLSSQAAEIASKQHLDSIKKVSKLDTECRSLRAASRKSSALNNPIKYSCNEQIPFPSPVCVKSLTDCPSNNEEQFVSLDNEPGCSDSWAPSLILEFDQVKQDKPVTRKLVASTAEIDLMDDFLEMEKLAALPEAGRASSYVDIDIDSVFSITKDGTLRDELEVMRRELADFQLKIVKLENEKVELDMALSKARSQLKYHCDPQMMDDDKLIEVQKELDIFDTHSVDAKKKGLKSKLESALLEIILLNEKFSLMEGKVEKVNELHTKIHTLEGKIKEEESILANLIGKMDIVEADGMKLSTQLESANEESVKREMKIRFLEEEVAQEKQLSAELAVKCQHLIEIKAEAETCMEAKNNDLELQIRSADLEIQRLQDKVSLMCKEVDEERLKCAQIAARFQLLEEEVSKKRHDDKIQQSLTLDAMLKLKEEKGIVMASEKFAACQKTLNSINQQLKSLCNFNNLLVEPEMSSYMDLPDLTGLGIKE